MPFQTPANPFQLCDIWSQVCARSFLRDPLERVSHSSFVRGWVGMDAAFEFGPEGGVKVLVGGWQL